jgi:phospholipid-binding lipoprotein MlaA
MSRHHSRLPALLFAACLLVVGSPLLRAQTTATTLTPAPAPQSSTTREPMADSDFDEYAPLKISDPFERYNRSIFKFNDVVYIKILTPSIKGYEYVVRPPVNRAIANFFNNLRYPVRLIANLAQLKLERAGRETGKFTVNTVAGLGFFRTAEHVPALAGIPREDLGQALGYWGVPNGPYLVLPILGGNSLRDFVGRAGDTITSPTGWDYINLGNRDWLDSFDWEWQTLGTVTDIASGLPDTLKLYGQMKSAAVDPYLSVRDATIRYRERETAR